MKFVQHITFASIAMASCGLFAAADDLSPQQLTEWIRNGDYGTVSENKGKITQQLLSTPIPTQFPGESITVATYQSGNLHRTIADEAAEQFFHDQDPFADKKVTEDAQTRTGLICLGALAGVSSYLLTRDKLSALMLAGVGGYTTHLYTPKGRTYYSSTVGVLNRITGVDGVSFNPTESALAAQSEYQEKYGFEDLVTKEYTSAGGLHRDIPQYCADTFAHRNPERALTGMKELPKLFFMKKQNGEGYELIARLKATAQRTEFSHDAGTIQLAGYVDHTTGKYVAVPHEEPRKTLVDEIYVGNGASHTTYAIPTTNTASKAEWKKADRASFDQSPADTNSLCISYGGRLSGTMWGGDSYHFYTQDKK